MVQANPVQASQGIDLGSCQSYIAGFDADRGEINVFTDEQGRAGVPTFIVIDYNGPRIFREGQEEINIGNSYVNRLK